jgi:LuxR family transcriptional regulator, maltose regulon positive regulatory protein
VDKASGAGSNYRRTNLIEGLDRARSMTSLATTPPWEHLEQPSSRKVPLARGLLDRKDLIQMLDRAVTKRVTVISAPPGSGKTSLLRAWNDHSIDIRRVAFVSVERDEQDAQRFWSAVLDALSRAASSNDPERQSAVSAGVDGDQLVDMVRSDLAELPEPVVLIVDDLRELKSADALAQLERLLAALPSAASVVLSSRRDPPIRLHQLRLADEVVEIRAGDLRFTEVETRELLAASGINLSDDGASALHERTEGWAAGLRLVVPQRSRRPGAFRG